MSTERDELAEDIRNLGITVIDGPPVDLSEPLAQHLHNLGYRKPRTITTTEELEEIERGTLVLASNGEAWRKYTHKWDNLNEIDDLLYPPHYIALPATVLHEGSAA